MKTTCEHCVFAKKDNGVQTGCELQYLDIFKERGKVSFAEEKYYEINETFCPACRNVYWLENHTKEDIKKELLLPYTAMVMDNGDPAFYETISKLYNLISRPKKIIISTIKYPLSSLSQLLDEVSKLCPGVEFLIDNSLDNLDHKARVKSAVKKTTTPYFLCVVPSDWLDLKFVDDENEAFQTLDNEWFSYNDEAFLCNTMLYKNFMNNENPVADMLEFMKKVRGGGV